MSVSTNTITEKPNSKVSYYRDNSTTSKNDVISIAVEAPTSIEAEELFTKKLGELNVK